MKIAGEIQIGLGCILAAFSLSGPRAAAQSFSSQPVVVGTGALAVSFSVAWTCDDDPGVTTGAPGEVDLVASNGNLVAEVTATVNGSTPQITLTGAGSVSNITSSINLHGAGGTPADGHMFGVWNVIGLSPGAYTLRFWAFQRSVPRNVLSEISTVTLDRGVSAPTPTPTPTPTPSPLPPTIALSAPASATAFQAVGIGATATMAAGGRPLASVAITLSNDNGNTWAAVSSNPHPSSPSDSESVSYAFAAAGNALLRATVTDSAGQTGTSTQTVVVAKAAQRAVALSPAVAAISTGQAVTFTATGGATGNYAWGGSASGNGAAQTVAFPIPGGFAVTVVDSGDANYNPSPTASAAVTVQAAFYTLSAMATTGGSVAGGGSYPPNAEATAVATPGSGNAFMGWTGDVTSASQTLSVLMSSNRSIVAHFSPLLSQVISFVQPQTVTTHAPAFSISASASSGLPVLLTLNSGPVSLAGNVATPTGTTGEVAMTATQSGNAQYLPAQPVVIAFAVGLPPSGVLLEDDSSGTKRSDKTTRTTSYTSGPAH